MSGIVHLVGAGSGDPGLLTVKGKRCLEQANAVVYDRLVSPRLLNLASPEAELYYVGKEAAAHVLPQEKINELLIHLAQAGKRVVRLKGGDPFVLGRGGEEAEALRQQGIAWEVVPGVTSAVSVPAYAGIPVTHRGVATGFTVMTGHFCATTSEMETVAGSGLVDGTLVVLMGVSQLQTLVNQLLRAGRAEDTPVALVRYGSTAAQEVLTATVATVVECVARAEFRAPAVTIVGDVVHLRERLQWFEARPLFGRRILVAADRAEDAARMAEALETLGAEVFDYAAERHAAPNTEVLDAVLQELLPESDRSLQQRELYFTTALEVQIFFAHSLKRKLDMRSWSGVSIGARDGQVQKALLQKGIVADFIAPTGKVLPSIFDLLHGDAMRDALGLWLKFGDRIQLDAVWLDSQSAREAVRSVCTGLSQEAATVFLAAPEYTTDISAEQLSTLLCV